jgi:hypothetical protein
MPVRAQLEDHRKTEVEKGDKRTATKGSLGQEVPAHHMSNDPAECQGAVGCLARIDEGSALGGGIKKATKPAKTVRQGKTAFLGQVWGERTYLFLELQIEGQKIQLIKLDMDGDEIDRLRDVLDYIEGGGERDHAEAEDSQQLE